MYNRSIYLNTNSPLKKELYSLFKKKEALTILDIGGCEGEDSVKYSRMFPMASIFVFEPLPDNQLRIQKNIELYGPGKIKMLAVALSDTVGEQDFYVSSGHPEEKEKDLDWDFGNKSSSLLPPDKHLKIVPWVQFNEVIRVRTDTLYNFLVSYQINEVDFIHMDVQGAELQVLSGAKEKIKSVKAIWLEVSEITLYKNQPLRKDIEEFMEQNGFYLVKSSIDGKYGDQFYLNSKYFKTFNMLKGYLKFHFRIHPK